MTVYERPDLRIVSRLDSVRPPTTWLVDGME
jgi:hypothetical protein